MKTDRTYEMIKDIIVDYDTISIVVMLLHWVIGYDLVIMLLHIIMHWLARVYATSKQISMWPTIGPLMTNSSGRFKHRPDLFNATLPLCCSIERYKSLPKLTDNVQRWNKLGQLKLTPTIGSWLNTED